MLRGRSAGRSLARLWTQLRQWSIPLSSFPLERYIARRRFRPPPGEPVDFPPESERRLVLDWHLVGGGRTQIWFSPSIAHAFFGAFEEDEIDRAAKLAYGGVTYDGVTLSDHYRGEPNPGTFGLNLPRALIAAIGSQRGFVIVDQPRRIPSYVVHFVIAGTNRAKEIEDAARASFHVQIGRRGPRRGAVMAAVIRRDALEIRDRG